MNTIFSILVVLVRLIIIGMCATMVYLYATVLSPILWNNHTSVATDMCIAFWFFTIAICTYAPIALPKPLVEVFVKNGHKKEKT